MVQTISSDTISVVCFDLDSTLVTVEGIDELARMNGTDTEVRRLTEQAMNGEIPFADIFFRRLDIIRPTMSNLLAVGELYIKCVTPGAVALLGVLRRRNIRVYVVSGGYNPAVRMVTRHLGIPDDDVFANELTFDTRGCYAGVNRDIPLWRNDGKTILLRTIRASHAGRIAYVGDSYGDWEAGKTVDTFIGYTGVVRRPALVRRTTYTCDGSLLNLLPLLE